MNGKNINCGYAIMDGRVFHSKVEAEQYAVKHGYFDPTIYFDDNTVKTEAGRKANITQRQIDVLIDRIDVELHKSTIELNNAGQQYAQHKHDLDKEFYNSQVVHWGAIVRGLLTAKQEILKYQRELLVIAHVCYFNVDSDSDYTL